jgi:hypothetical protein
MPATEQPTLEDQFEPTPAPATVVAATDHTTAAGFEARAGDVLIEGRRPATWLADAMAREHEITRRMGLLDEPKRGAYVA